MSHCCSNCADQVGVIATGTMISDQVMAAVGVDGIDQLYPPPP